MGGLVMERRCTDFAFIIALIITTILMVIIGIICFAKGKPLMLFRPYDGSGNFCGVGG